MDALQLRARRRPHRRGSPPDTRLLMSSSPFSGFWLAPLETVSNVLQARAGACPAGGLSGGEPGRARSLRPVHCGAWERCCAWLCRDQLAGLGCTAGSRRGFSGFNARGSLTRPDHHSTLR